MLSAEAEADAAVGAVVAATTVVAVEAKTVVDNSQVAQVEVRPPNTRVLNTPICRLETGRAVPCISGGAVQLSSAPSPALARGRMCSRKNETVTSPANWIQNY